MANAMKKLYAMAMAMAAMGGGVDGLGVEPPRMSLPKNSSPKIKLSGVKHVGPIPRGCTVQRVEIIASKGKYHISIIVEIVAATNKAFNQKLVAKQKEVSTYIAFTSVEKLLADERFVLTEIPENDKVED
jgi:hypothetical protein